MEFRVEVLDYGRHGCTAMEPRTGLKGHGRDKEAALADLASLILLHLTLHGNDVPPAEGPERSFVTLRVGKEGG